MVGSHSDNRIVWTTLNSHVPMDKTGRPMETQTQIPNQKQGRMGKGERRRRQACAQTLGTKRLIASILSAAIFALLANLTLATGFGHLHS